MVLTYLLTGQLAVRRVEQQLQLSLADLRATAAAMSDELEIGSDPAARRELFARHRVAAPGIGWALRPLEGGLDGEGPLDPALLLPEGRVQTSLEAVGYLEDRSHFLAVVPPPGPAGTLIVYQRIEPELRPASKAPPTSRCVSPWRPAKSWTRSRMPTSTSTGTTARRVRLRLGPDPRSGSRQARLPPQVPGSWLFGKNFVMFPRAVELPYVDWADSDWHAAIEGNDQFHLVAQTSMAREYIELFQSVSGEGVNRFIGQGAVAIPQYLSIAVLTLYLLAAAIAGMLIYRIARATSCLLKGFHQVEQGNFQVALTFAGRDQLAGLVQSFNRMARHLAQSVEEKAEREAIERELGIARQLQRSLLPPADYRAHGFEIAVDFVPAQAIGGDFYHFTRRDDGRLLITIADVSGHGLSTGIVMSAAKALLSALATDHCPCAELLRRPRQRAALAHRPPPFRHLGALRLRPRARHLRADQRRPPLPLPPAAGRHPDRDREPVPAAGGSAAAEFPQRRGAARKGRFVDPLLRRGDRGAKPGRRGFRLRKVREPAARLRRPIRPPPPATGCSKPGAQFTGGECPDDDRTLLVIRIAD